MKILHVIASVHPSSGGPAEGVLRRGVRLTEMGHIVEVVSLDPPSSKLDLTYPLPLYLVGGESKSVYRYSPELVPWLLNNSKKYDFVVVNGVWQYHSYGAWKALKKTGVPYVVFTHGMLDPWFKKAYPLKHMKKWLYWPWADYRVLRDAEAVLFTSEEEMLCSRQSFWLYSANEVVVSYGTTLPTVSPESCRRAFLDRFPNLVGKKYFLFLSRIHEKKGCDLLLKAFRRFLDVDPSYELVIAGDGREAYVESLVSMANDLGLSAKLTWTGLVRDELKWGAVLCSDVFVLPSHQENFGIAVVEALAMGVPVIISDKVNIWREIKIDGAGVVCSDNPDSLLQSMIDWSRCEESERERYRVAARKSFESRYTIDAMANSLLGVAESVLKIPR